MKGLRATCVAIMVFCLIAGEYAAYAAAPIYRDRTAELYEISGSVEMKSGDNGGWSAAKIGTTVPVGGSVKTGKDSYATIRIDDGAETIFIELDSDSKLTLVELATGRTTGNKTTLVSLDMGKANVKAKNLSKSSVFEIKTPTSVLKTQGSDSSFNVQVEKLE